MADQVYGKVNVTGVFRGFDETSNEQVFEVSPTPPALFSPANWNLRDEIIDYPHSLNPGFKRTTAIDIRYLADPARTTGNYVGESWTFDWDGKVRLARKVQCAAGEAGVFDIDDFAQAAIKFCLHGLNLLLRARPFPEELEFSVCLSDLRGKMLQNRATVENVPDAGAVCRTSGNLSRVFSLPLRPPANAVRLLRNQLLIIVGAVAGAFEPLLAGPPLTVPAQRFAWTYWEILSSLTLRGVRAVATGPFADAGAPAGARSGQVGRRGNREQGTGNSE